jgi:mono/diheme cytochrome c family protein
MFIRKVPWVALVASAVLFATACQSTVNVSNAKVDLRTGLPPAPPDPPEVPVRPAAIQGREVFEKTGCVQCHGPQGLGNGPLAAGLKSPGKSLYTDFLALFGIRAKGEQLPSRPANFHNTVAMRLNSPYSMYETVTRGRPNTAMPAFGPKAAYGATRFGSARLSDEARWNVIFHEWTFSTSPAEVARGKLIYETKLMDIGGTPLTCAACHGVRGDGRGSQDVELSQKLWGWARRQGPGIFTDINLMAQRKPTELYQSIVDGHGAMPGYRGKLSDEELWALVNYIWTFVYDYPWQPANKYP